METLHNTILKHEQASKRRSVALRRHFNQLLGGGDVAVAQKVLGTINSQLTQLKEAKTKHHVTTARQQLREKRAELETIRQQAEQVRQQAEQRATLIKKEIAELQTQIKTECAPLEALHKHLQFSHLKDAELEKVHCECDATSDWNSKTSTVANDVNFRCGQLECCSSKQSSSSSSCDDKYLKTLQETLKRAKERDDLMRESALGECQEFDLFNK